MLKNGFHLTYCTNIHPGESWDEIFGNLKYHIPKIKKELVPEGEMGIGLRLSNIASQDLIKEERLAEFKSWLKAEGAYVFTFNGFPYGGFHRQVVKDQVHHPDWTRIDRRDYTLRLFDTLKELIPEGLDGGISTSPLSYKYWYNNEQGRKEAWQLATTHIVEVALRLYEISQKEGKVLHLDIEPEPDGFLENTQDVLDFYSQWLLPIGKKIFVRELKLTEEEAEIALKEHIRICYDVCHFAVVYEKAEDVLKAFKAAGIKIGKIQISAALKVAIPGGKEERQAIKEVLQPFVESTYLHQVVGRDPAGVLTSHNDLPQALEKLENSTAEEWRIHFHVPVFLAQYSQLSSTQRDILDVLDLLRDNAVTSHLEVETYTWEVLPKDVNLDLTHSIIRELQWVIENME